MALLLRASFFKVLSTSGLYIASNGGLIVELSIRKDLKETDDGLMKVLFRNLPEGTEENSENPFLGYPAGQSRLETSTFQIQVW
jgi:hypothetical protein